MRMIKKLRIPIALRLFYLVLLTTLLITALSVGVLHWALQKNFSHYVTQVEIQKLGHLNNNLAEIYQVYGDWTTALNKNHEMLRESPDMKDDEHFPQRWLNRQYTIAQEQEQIFHQPHLLHNYRNRGEEVFIPSHFQPFERPKGVDIHQKENDPHDVKDNNAQSSEKAKRRRWFILLPDRSSIGNRLALYDANKKVVIGQGNQADNVLQEIKVDGRIVGYLGLRSALDIDDALSLNFFSQQQRYLLLILAALIVVSALAALLFANNFKKPIHRLLNAAVELSKENYQYRVEVSRNDELGDLSKLMNKLAVVLEQHEQSRKQWVADTSHELKTPISVLQAQIEAMQDGVRKPTSEHFARMMHQVSSLKKLTQDLADLAQADAEQMTLHFHQVDTWEIVLHEIENFQPKFMEKNLTLLVEGEGVRLQTDPDRFRQIIVNILSNNIRYTHQGGKIHIHTELTEDQWVLHIDDSPLGVTDEQLQHLGERFYRVDDSRARSTGGTGLGLALSKKIAHLLNGDLQFSHSPLGGLRCTLRLSLHEQIIEK